MFGVFDDILNLGGYLMAYYFKQMHENSIHEDRECGDHETPYTFDDVKQKTGGGDGRRLENRELSQDGELRAIFDKCLRKVFDGNFNIQEISELTISSKKSLSSVWRVKLVDQASRESSVVIREACAGPFGFEYPEDLARQAMFCFRAFNHVAGHAEAYGVGVRTENDEVLSLNDARHFYVVEEFVEGENYGAHLTSLHDQKYVDLKMERKRAAKIAEYLALVHKRDDLEISHVEKDQYYKRALRDILGSGEGLMGVVDSFPNRFRKRHGHVLEEIESRCLELVQRHRDKKHRLSRVHGDFHPGNILIEEGNGVKESCEIKTIDKSRVDLNDAANDVGALIMNYLVLDLHRSQFDDMIGLELARTFLRGYLEKTRDYEILEMLPLFVAMRSAAAVSPVFYPGIAMEVCSEAFTLALKIVQQDRFDETFGFARG